MKMTRNQHWVRAQELLGQVKDRSCGGRLTQEDRDLLAVAQVHATLAAAPDRVVGE